MLREYLRELKDGELKVGEPEVRAYFDEHQEDFKKPVTVVASHILCLTAEDAEAALKRVKKGENFAQVARDVSKDPSAARGGMIGEVGRGDLSDLPEFEKQLFGLRKGEVSGVVQTKSAGSSKRENLTSGWTRPSRTRRSGSTRKSWPRCPFPPLRWPNPRPICPRAQPNSFHGKTL
jgi:hypothetical protein